MNKLTTAVFGLTLLAGSVFAAVPQATDSKMADSTKTTDTAKKPAKKVKKAKTTKTTKKSTAAPAAAAPTKM